MATPHPYISGAIKNIEKIINYLRENGLPRKISDSTLKKAKVSLIYKNRLIHALRFIGVIDNNGHHSKEIEKLFSEEDDKKFADDFASLIKKAYSLLFDLYEDDAWNLNREELISFFDKNDNLSSFIAARQARTFIAFASLIDNLSNATVLPNDTPTMHAEVYRGTDAETDAETETDIGTSESAQYLTEKSLEKILARLLAENYKAYPKSQHPFDERDIHPEIVSVTQKLFDDKHYAYATFEACKLLEKNVGKLINSKDWGQSVMKKSFGSKEPKIKLSNNRSEQEGYLNLFCGTVAAIRNPIAHEVGVNESEGKCLGNLSLLSMLMQKLEDSQKT